MSRQTKAVKPEDLAGFIASGVVTRERSCDGKTGFKTYGQAAEKIEQHRSEGREQYVYPCPFCARFHIATGSPPPSKHKPTPTQKRADRSET